MDSLVTRGVKISVVSQYSPEHSDPQHRQWFFIYTITIINESEETVQLISRHWKIMDAEGRHEEVRGSGVVGEQPVLDPGESFEYSSGCPLPTPFGSMDGTYSMVDEAGTSFDVTIPPFALRNPENLQ